MFYGGVSTLWALLAMACVLAPPAIGQSVISTRSGVVHFWEGAVYLDNQPLESHPPKFPSVPEGAELRTAEGRIEVLLTPAVFLRIGENSAIRMLTNELSNTRVELLSGSAVVDSAVPGSGTSVSLLYRNWSLHFLEQGVYRIDSDPGRLWVLHGKVEISAGKDERKLLVEQGMYLRFVPLLVPERSIDQPRDALSIWAEGRQRAIAADNTIAANTRDPASIHDPASMSASNSGSSFASPIYTYLPAIGAVVGVSYAVFSTTPRRSSALLPSTQYGFARVLSDTPSHSARATGIRAVRLLRSMSTRVQLHVAVPSHPVSRVGGNGAVRRSPP